MVLCIHYSDRKYSRFIIYGIAAFFREVVPKKKTKRKTMSIFNKSDYVPKSAPTEEHHELTYRTEVRRGEENVQSHSTNTLCVSFSIGVVPTNCFEFSMIQT